MDPDYEIKQLEVFLAMFRKGLIQRRFRPVNWSPSSRTALAEAEVEYKDDHLSRSVYAKFPLTKSDSGVIQDLIHKGSKKPALLIWTTTPWTLPANQAVIVDPKLDYTLAEANDGQNFVVATSRLEHMEEILGSGLTSICTFTGDMLLGSTYSHPFGRPDGKVLGASWVTADSGTGLVHAAPAHGMDDYETCKDQRIEENFCPVDDKGRYIPEKVQSIPGNLGGLEVLGSGNEAVIQYLDREDLLIKEVPLKHKYPYDWRTRKPLIQRYVAVSISCLFLILH